MKYAIFSDVHGNVFAFEQMLKELKMEDINGYICCGDIAGYYYDQDSIVADLKTLENLLIIKGNHDIYYDMAYKDKDKKIYFSKKYGNSYILDIKRDVVEFINLLPIKIVTKIQGYKIGIFHGSPNDLTNGRIYPDYNVTDDSFQQYDICFLGNTHYRMLKNIQETIVINPGSLGQPRDGKGFSYCIFDFNSLHCDFRTVEFNKDKLKEKVYNIENNEKHRNYLLNVLDRREKND